MHREHRAPGLAVTANWGKICTFEVARSTAYAWLCTRGSGTSFESLCDLLSIRQFERQRITFSGVTLSVSKLQMNQATLATINIDAKRRDVNTTHGNPT